MIDSDTLPIDLFLEKLAVEVHVGILGCLLSDTSPITLIISLHDVDWAAKTFSHQADGKRGTQVSAAD
jgi:hypothetical protein